MSPWCGRWARWLQWRANNWFSAAQSAGTQSTPSHGRKVNCREKNLYIIHLNLIAKVCIFREYGHNLQKFCDDRQFLWWPRVPVMTDSSCDDRQFLWWPTDHSMTDSSCNDRQFLWWPTMHLIFCFCNYMVITLLNLNSRCVHGFHPRQPVSASESASGGAPQRVTRGATCAERQGCRNLFLHGQRQDRSLINQSRGRQGVRWVPWPSRC